MIAAGEKKRGSTDGLQTGRGILVMWAGTRLALCKRGTCRCRCSSSNSFYQPSEREVTSNSFDITHLLHVFLRRSLVETGGLWERDRTSKADVGENRVRRSCPTWKKHQYHWGVCISEPVMRGESCRVQRLTYSLSCSSAHRWASVWEWPNSPYFLSAINNSQFEKWTESHATCFITHKEKCQ